MVGEGDSDNVSPVNVDLHYKNIASSKESIDPTPSVLSIEDLPEWYDEKLFKKGQEYVRRNMFSITAAQFMGLLSVFTLPATLDVLLFTKQSSSPCAAFKRYLQTMIHVHTLHLENIKNPDSKWWKSLNTIRWKHATMSKKSGEKGIGQIPQHDMVLTQFGFIGYVLLNSKQLGFSNDPELLEGFVHLWRVVGYLLGIPNKLNLCRKNVPETTELCKRVLTNSLVDYINKMSEECKTMTKTVVDGFWYIDIGIDYDTTMRLWYDLHGLKYEKVMNWSSQMNYSIRKSIFYLLGVPYIQHLVRYLVNCSVKITLWSGEYFPILAWTKWGYEKATIKLYPIPLKKKSS
ncbi:uncharacterized protein [Chelonus insularis]|uniref:uncharacterized protein n=1 Tax=Chelonus insularis TaxID=460826 RepID=UPI00158AB646|nr:uncharacterized protein LOC118074054 [Chelonus insularis]XP_034950840.1 uncharacterized protein LOC118074054 [Chelonus insularis]